MKVSLNTIAYENEIHGMGYDPYREDVKILLARIGEQLAAVEDVEYWGPRYDGIVVAKVVSCEKHPDADKLSVCRVDDGRAVKDVERGDDGLIQVVCGAPNVKSGMVAAWIPPTATVPSTIGKEPFVLEAREIRGKISNGMLASPKELGLGDTHDGILEIRAEDVGEELIKPGTPFKKLYGLDDIVIDLENKMFTHRPDCFGNLGVARELAGISGQAFKSPNWYKSPLRTKPESQLDLNVINNATENVSRYMAQAMQVEVKASLMWLQSYLIRIGQRPINNIVDYTNYFMMETAQPLHAFDYDKVKALSGEKPTIMARMAEKGEELTLLNNKTIKLNPDDIVIATDKQVIGLAGVMGGADTEVDESTKTIVIESANFDMYTIRRTAMRHGLFTDAVTRFNKGQSPHQTDRVLAKIVDELIKVADGKVVSDVFDLKSANIKMMPAVTVAVDFINTRLGSSLAIKDMQTLLENVEFEVTADGDNLTVIPPFWRRDIEIPEDIVEEVGRLYGYGKLPVNLPTRAIEPAPSNSLFELNQDSRSKLSSAGANELVTYSFVHGDLISKVGQDPAKAFHLRNALSPDLQYYRLSLMPSLLDKVYANLRSDLVRSEDNEFALFEIGRLHMKGVDDEHESGIPKEDTHLSLVFAADQKTADRKYQSSAFYEAKKYLDQVLPGVGEKLVLLSTFDFKNDDWGKQMAAPFEPVRSGVIMRDGMAWGIVGEFKNSVKKALKLPLFSAGFEVALDLISEARSKAYQPLPAYPKVVQDISLKVPKNINYGDLYTLIWNGLTSAQKEHGYYPTLGPLDIYQPADGDTKNIAFRVWLSHYERTLTAEEVNNLLDKIAASAKETYGADRL